MISDLINARVDVLVAVDNTAIAQAAKSATSTVPIVFSIGTDPIKFGLVSSLSRPEGNVTGVVSLTVGHGVKRLQVLPELLPHARTLAMLVNPNNPAAQSATREITSAARAANQTVAAIHAASPPEIDAASARASNNVPPASTVDAYSDFVREGGLMS